MNRDNLIAISDRRRVGTVKNSRTSSEPGQLPLLPELTCPPTNSTYRDWRQMVIRHCNGRCQNFKLKTSRDTCIALENPRKRRQEFAAIPLHAGYRLSKKSTVDDKSPCHGVRYALRWAMTKIFAPEVVDSIDSLTAARYLVSILFHSLRSRSGMIRPSALGPDRR